jgi:hypothetical protein
MDPLSIAASVAGLLTVGGKLAAMLTQISRLSDAPSLCKAVLIEVCETTAALRQLQTLVDGRLESTRERREQVLLEHLATALVGCVMTKDELETVLDDLGLAYADGAISGTFDRAKWIRKEADIQKHVQRLQNHKSSLNLILSVLQCNSTAQIRDSVDRLCDLMQEAVANNSTLVTRLERLEGNSTLGYAETERQRNSDQESVETVKRAAGSQVEQRDGQEIAQWSFTFDTELQDSRVYRKMLLFSDSHSTTSVTSTTRQKAAASIFSAISLAEISNISLFSLPIFIQEVANGGWYVHMGSVTATSSLRVGPTGMTFSVRDLNGIWKQYIVSPTELVSQLKERIKYPPPDQIVLVYCGSRGVRKLHDDRTFAELNIPPHGGTIEVLLRYRAGGRTELENALLERENRLAERREREVQQRGIRSRFPFGRRRRRTVIDDQDWDLDEPSISYEGFNVNVLERFDGG